MGIDYLRPLVLHVLGLFLQPRVGVALGSLKAAIELTGATRASPCSFRPSAMARAYLFGVAVLRIVDDEGFHYR